MTGDDDDDDDDEGGDEVDDGGISADADGLLATDCSVAAVESDATTLSASS